MLKTAILVKRGFHEQTELKSFYEFATTDGRYFKTYSFHQKSNDGLTWRASVTSHGNNEGKLFQRTYWYVCTKIIGE